MLTLAFWILAATALAGAGVGALFLRPVWRRLPRLAVAHGIAGTIGLAAFALSLQMTAASVGTDRYAAILLSFAWVTGLALFFLPLRARRGLGWLIGCHAALALAGFALVALYWFRGTPP
jgi:hypothetical protein